MKKYTYKNIIIFESWRGWYADYKTENSRFALHRCFCDTKAKAYKIAKEEVDFLNRK